MDIIILSTRNIICENIQVPIEVIALLQTKDGTQTLLYNGMVCPGEELLEETCLPERTKRLLLEAPYLGEVLKEIRELAPKVPIVMRQVVERECVGVYS